MGIKTDNLPSASVVKEVVAHVETAGVKSLATIPVEKLVTQVGCWSFRRLHHACRAPGRSGLERRRTGEGLGAMLSLPIAASIRNRGDAGAGAWTRIGPLPETDLSHSLRVPSGESINPFPDAATRGEHGSDIRRHGPAY